MEEQNSSVYEMLDTSKIRPRNQYEMCMGSASEPPISATGPLSSNVPPRHQSTNAYKKTSTFWKYFQVNVACLVILLVVGAFALSVAAYLNTTALQFSSDEVQQLNTDAIDDMRTEIMEEIMELTDVITDTRKEIMELTLELNSTKVQLNEIMNTSMMPGRCS